MTLRFSHPRTKQQYMQRGSSTWDSQRTPRPPSPYTPYTNPSIWRPLVACDGNNTRPPSQQALDTPRGRVGNHSAGPQRGKRASHYLWTWRQAHSTPRGPPHGLTYADNDGRPTPFRDCVAPLASPSSPCDLTPTMSAFPLPILYPHRRSCRTPNSLAASLVDDRAKRRQQCRVAPVTAPSHPSPRLQHEHVQGLEQSQFGRIRQLAVHTMWLGYAAGLTIVAIIIVYKSAPVRSLQHSDMRNACHEPGSNAPIHNQELPSRLRELHARSRLSTRCPNDTKNRPVDSNVRARVFRHFRIATTNRDPCPRHSPYATQQQQHPSTPLPLRLPRCPYCISIVTVAPPPPSPSLSSHSLAPYRIPIVLVASPPQAWRPVSPPLCLAPHVPVFRHLASPSCLSAIPHPVSPYCLPSHVSQPPHAPLASSAP
ncbi:hypothetical protein BOTBODRAFT_170766 [Botryobasidium botryosum FD-172 SS1]|uniref:Uncharacterized protein n=1 Tax=Botryobasidium botryosum (strain FD-172 SS1) TaxID=930990 RepID=A0A067MVN7_BOTB1|nr:hypothetical protein BOTBODRAFT_170766 [Botryobasidium botryosum FD-172 SS1]